MKGQQSTKNFTMGEFNVLLLEVVIAVTSRSFLASVSWRLVVYFGSLVRGYYSRKAKEIKVKSQNLKVKKKLNTCSPRSGRSTREYLNF